VANSILADYTNDNVEHQHIIIMHKAAAAAAAFAVIPARLQVTPTTVYVQDQTSHNTFVRANNYQLHTNN